MCNGTTKSTGNEREILPANVKPTNYNVTIIPGLETFKYSGQVSVSLHVLEATKNIVANAHEVSVSNASLTILKLNEMCLVADWSKDPKTGRFFIRSNNTSYNKELQTVSFEFDKKIPAGAIVMLHLDFEGIHNDQMAGFYRSGYTDSTGNKKYLVVTQFEATDCRRCFPCWDEPNLKATFDMTLIVPKDRTALSNMNVIEETDIEINGKQLNCIKFATTPIMSTYLLAMCVGEFDYTEAIANPIKPAGAKPITCRTYTLKGQKEMGHFGLSVCTKTLEFFSEYFDIAYPLPKMDMIAIPDFGAGAMENWGLVTYRETALLYDSKNSSAAAKERVAYVVCHELAHQWFGNLVTMDWWNELWLNEGFATFVGWLAVDHIFPEWNVFTSFVLGDYERGVTLDSMLSSHPIEVDVKSPSEVAQIFDAISYSKGASVIRMLNAYLSGEVFANGVRNYLKKHAYGNARTVDLWSALSDVSNQDIGKMMYSWTRDVGYPVISVVNEEYNEAKNELTLTISQERFLSSGQLKPEDDQVIWHIPISVVTHNISKPTVHLLTEKVGKISFNYESAIDNFYKLNANVTGFYRVRYSEKFLEKLGSAIEKQGQKFTITDKIGISADAFAIASAGLGSTAGALEVIKSYKNEENQMVLQEVSTRVGTLKNVFFRNKPAIDGLKALQRYIFSPKVEALGYEYSDSDDHLTALKRTLAINAAANGEDKNVVAQLQDRYKKYAAGDMNAFHPNLRSCLFSTILKHTITPGADFDTIFKLYENGATADEKVGALGTIGAINDLSLSKKILNEIVLDSSKVKTQDSYIPIVSLAIHSPKRLEVLELIWEFITRNWTQLHDTLIPSLLGHVVKSGIQYCIGEEYAIRTEKWAAGNDCQTEEEKELRKKQVKKVQRALDQGLESLRNSTRWYERDEQLVMQWLSVGGFQ